MRHETNKMQEILWFSKAEGVQADSRVKRAAKAVAWATTFALLFLSGPHNAIAAKLADGRKPKPYSLLKNGLTQTPDAELLEKIAAREAAQQNKPAPTVRALTAGEMQSVMGRGPYRNKYFAGAPMPWHRSLRDVNLCTGNLFKSFTDIQIAPARGAGLALQRTYSSQDERVGPFGIGWTHAYDIRIDETSEVDPDTGDEIVTRADFFGGKHAYRRDADGLYTPPAYMFDEMDSKYDTYLTDGPPPVVEDVQKSMDGTVQHFIPGGTRADGTASTERVCDYIEDRHGNRTNLTYGQTITLVGGGTQKLLTEVKDPSNRTLTFTWQNLGSSSAPAWRITQVQGPSGTYRVTYQYNTDKNLSSVTLDPDGLNRTTSFGYTSYSGQDGNETGLLNSISDSSGQNLQYSYQVFPIIDLYGNNAGVYELWVSQVKEPAGVDTQGSTRQQIWNIRGKPGNDGGAAFVTNDMTPGTLPMDQRYHRQLSFDGLRRVTISAVGEQTEHDYSQIWVYTYSSSNNVTKTERWIGPNNGVPGTYPTTQATYGPHGNVLTTRQLKNYYYPQTFYPPTVYTYYNASKYFQKASITDPMGRISTFDYYGTGDADTTQANRGEVRWVRDPGYNVSSSPSYGKQFTYGYNNYGLKAWETDLKGTVTKYTYGDAWGNLTQVVRDPSDPQTGYTGLNRTSIMNYDIAGRLISSTDALNQTSFFQYNNLGQQLCANFPARGSAPAETILYNYGLSGRIDSITDGRGTTSINYETGCDRVASVTDPVTGTVSYTYLLSGEKTSASYNGETTRYQYTPVTTWQIGGFSPQLVVSEDNYDQASRVLKRIVDAQGRIVDVTLGLDGRLWKTRFNQTFNNGNADATPRQWCESVYQYNDAASGYGKPTLQSVSTTYNLYDYWNETGETHLLQQNQYQYNDADQRTSNVVTDSTGVQRIETYNYDELSRLKNVNYGDGQTHSYGFDAMGNRLTKTNIVGGNSQTENYNYDNLNQLTNLGTGGSTSTYTNDALGNTLNGGGRANTWDSQNRLIACINGSGTTQKINEFVYGSDGLRHRMTTTNSDGSQTRTEYVVQGGKVVAEIVQQRSSSNAAWTAPRTISYFAGLYRKDSTNQTDVRWYIYDGLGSVVGEVNVNGQVTATKKYDVYGITRAFTGISTSKHGFVANMGHASDDETGLIYMRARYYDPVLGRFTSEDPASSGRNWFVYCSNNPTNNLDFSGKSVLVGSAEASAEAAAAGAKAAAVALAAGSFLALTLRVILNGYNDRLELAIDGCYLAESKRGSKMGTNGKEKADFEYAIRGLGLTRAERRRVHDAITGQGFSLQEIRQEAEEIVKNRRNGQDEGDDSGDDDE